MVGYTMTKEARANKKKDTRHVIMVPDLEVRGDYKDVSFGYQMYTKYVTAIQPALA